MGEGAETRMCGLWNAMAKSQLLPRGGQSLPLRPRAMAIPPPCLYANILFELFYEIGEAHSKYARSRSHRWLWFCVLPVAVATGQDKAGNTGHQTSIVGKHPFLVDEQMNRSGA
jgi:hypothetical protein